MHVEPQSSSRDTPRIDGDREMRPAEGIDGREIGKGRWWAWVITSSPTYIFYPRGEVADRGNKRGHLTFGTYLTYLMPY